MQVLELNTKDYVITTQFLLLPTHLKCCVLMICFVKGNLSYVYRFGATHFIFSSLFSSFALDASATVFGFKFLFLFIHCSLFTRWKWMRFPWKIDGRRECEFAPTRTTTKPISVIKPLWNNIVDMQNKRIAHHCRWSSLYREIDCNEKNKKKKEKTKKNAKLTKWKHYIMLNWLCKKRHMQHHKFEKKIIRSDSLSFSVSLYTLDENVAIFSSPAKIETNWSQSINFVEYKWFRFTFQRAIYFEIECSIKTICSRKWNGISFTIRFKYYYWNGTVFEFKRKGERN